MKASTLPWRITDPEEKKGREIVDSRGLTVAKLTALDMPNAELIVKAVNVDSGIVHVKAVAELVVGKDYWLVSKRYPDSAPAISQCRSIESKGWKYFDAHIWAMEDNNQAMEFFDIFGPVEPLPLPDFEALKTKK